MIVNAAYYSLQFFTGLFISEGFDLERKYLKCGARVLGRRAEPPKFDECGRCEYNLTGNVSGKCPECGWKLPRRYRACRRKADAGLDQDANG